MAEEKLTKKEIKEKVEAGWLHVNLLFELVGSPRRHVEKTLRDYLDNIATDKKITPLQEDFEEAIPVEKSDGLYSVAAEVEYLVHGLEKLTWFAFNFMPASIEVKAPKELTFKEKDLTDWLNDLLAKLHEVNTSHTAMKSEHQEMVKSLNAAISNAVLLATEEARTSKQIGEKVGLPPASVMKFLETLIKNDKIEKKGQKYQKK